MLQLLELGVVEQGAVRLPAQHLAQTLERALVLHELEVRELEFAPRDHPLDEAGIGEVVAGELVALAAREIAARSC